jgi:uncharacterized membrane protein YkvA (DUF1232 family)
MTELETRCFEAFPAWLRSLADDTTGLAELLAADAVPEAARRQVAGGLNYLFKSLDLIPDGIEELGFMDDAFVLRISALVASEVPGAKEADKAGVLGRLAADVSLIRELLGKDEERLTRYVRELTKGAARGRSVQEIIADASIRSAFVSELCAWGKSYTPPTLSRDPKNLVKLKSFLSAKLPK